MTRRLSPLFAVFDSDKCPQRPDTDFMQKIAAEDTRKGKGREKKKMITAGGRKF